MQTFRHKRQDIETMYDNNSAATDSDEMLLNATKLPRLMRDRIAVKTIENNTALIGMSQPGRTCTPQR